MTKVKLKANPAPSRKSPDPDLLPRRDGPAEPLQK
jgi:hypothetical protein